MVGVILIGALLFMFWCLLVSVKKADEEARKHHEKKEVQ